MNSNYVEIGMSSFFSLFLHFLLSFSDFSNVLAYSADQRAWLRRSSIVIIFYRAVKIQRVRPLNANRNSCESYTLATPPCRWGYCGINALFGEAIRIISAVDFKISALRDSQWQWRKGIVAFTCLANSCERILHFDFIREIRFVPEYCESKYARNCV